MAVAEGKMPCRSRSTPAMKALLIWLKGKAFIMRLLQQNPEDDCIWDRNFLKTYSDVMSSQGDFEGVNPVQSVTDEFGRSLGYEGTVRHGNHHMRDADRAFATSQRQLVCQVRRDQGDF